MENKAARYWIFVSLLLLLVSFELAAFVLWVPGDWNAKVSGILAIIGIYGFTTGFVSRVAVFKENPDIISNYTVSPNIIKFFAGNAQMFGLILMLLGNSLSPERKPGSSFKLWIVGILTILPIVPILLIYPIVYMLVVVPIAYVPNLIASSIVDLVLSSAKDTEVTVAEPTKNEISFHLSRMVSDDPTSTKAFLIGIPSLTLSIYGVVARLIIG